MLILKKKENLTAVQESVSSPDFKQTTTTQYFIFKKRKQT